MLGLGDLLTQVQRHAPVVHIVLNNGMLDFVNIEHQEAAFRSGPTSPTGTSAVSPKRSAPEASASKNPAKYATACRPRSAIKAGPSWSTSWSTGTRWPGPPRAREDGGRLHPQPGQESAARADGRGHRHRPAQRPAPLKLYGPGRAHPLRGASTSSRWWLATLLEIVLSRFDLLVRELQSDFTWSGTLCRGWAYLPKGPPRQVTTATRSPSGVFLRWHISHRNPRRGASKDDK